ncbi:MAG: hypothetical protein LC721_10050 [Actinobacteria bacterium]|nr:hypothetical protein [Actinomycetota bacterium]
MRTLGRRLIPLMVAAALLVGSSATLVSADPGGAKLLDAQLTGLPAGTVNTTLFGVQAGGLPWRLDSGSARLFANGRLQVTVRHLVLAGGTREGTNPIGSAQAILTCAGAPAAWSSVVPYSPDGNAQINQFISLPPSCPAPAIFFAGVPAPGVDRWFAVTGW